jgi:hypothetical protein
VPDPKGEDAIITHALTDNPDFSDQNALAGEIEMGTLSFLRDVENFLANHKE